MTSKRLWLIAPIVIVLIGLVRLPSQAVTPQPIMITVSAASSLTDVMPRIGAAFTKQYPATKVRFTFGGSPQLVEQVLAGAPIDVLITASESTMEKAAQAGAVSRPTTIAKNSMAIAMPAGNPAKIRSLNDLARSDVIVAVCAPAVPCGAATTELLSRNAVTIRPASQELDVRSVLSKVIADEADAGIVYVSDVRAAGSAITSVAIPAAKNATTTYPIARVTDSAHATQSNAFMRFVRTSPIAQRILRDAGFQRP